MRSPMPRSLVRAFASRVCRRPVASLAAAALAGAGLIGCGDDVALTDARPQIDAAVPGQLSLSWSVAHMATPLTCAAVGASTVSLEIVPDGDAFGVVDTFDCASAMGTTRMLAPGLYQLRISLAGTGGTLDGPDDIRDITVPPGGTATVPPVTFDVDPTGGMKFRITTPVAGGNCADAASGGAGITAMRIELRDATNTCVPALFTVAAGASDPGGSYASDCSGSTTTCIAADQDVSISGLRSGSYSMVMIGSVGGAACWRRQPNAEIPAAGLVTELPAQQLALQAGVPGCPTM
ncbi:MAG TPA: hypothetical protein VHE35_16035 [Kofleriaceae bacterium]|nr:hypothetical protein [Kofleriaceae bacterium]